MKKVLILGSTGMLGHQVYFHLSKMDEYEVFDLSFRNKLRDETILCDITDFDNLSEIIKKVRPAVIVNCIGILIKGSNQNPKNSILINAYFPHWLVSVAEEINSKVIHISTDCVFSGKKGAYSESDFRDADDVYGRGKALGEIKNDRHLTLRTSIIGPELKSNGEGLFHWFMNQVNEVNGFTKSFWSGVTTVELAKIIEKCIKEEIFGLYHVTNGIPVSKVDKSLKTEYPEIFGPIPSYEDMISEMRSFIKSNNSIYSSNYPDVR
jgi:dTDP-4-dehydrorhamnose reductase